MAHRVRCFFDIEVDGIPSGRIIFELFSDVCPKTCENFRALCTGEMGNGKTTDKPLHYRGVKFHRVIKDFMIQGGDFSAGNGTGGESIYGGQFEDETFDIHHEEPFLLSMANRGKDTNGSQFFITTQPSPHLDGKHVVFGRVVNGKEVVAAIEDLPVDNRSRPLQPAVISNCGELILQRSVKTKEKKHKKKKVSSSDGDSDTEKKKKKKKKEKKQKKHKKSKSSDEEGEVKEDEETPNGAAPTILRPHPFATVSVINPDEIPDVPKNRFLYRGGPEKDGDQMRIDRGRERVRAYTKSGRKVKGRGSLRYRTPSRSRSRSRSVTPPHWRQAQRRTIPYDVLQRREEGIQMRQQEREHEIEERRRRREERHREMEGKDLDGEGRHQSGYFGRMRGNWQNPRDRNRDRDRREEQGWRNAREKRTFREEGKRHSKNSEDSGYADVKEKMQHQQEKFVAECSESNHKMKKEAEAREELEGKVPSDGDEPVPSEGATVQKEDHVKREKHEVLDENALDYEAMDNDEEEDEEEEEKQGFNGKIESKDEPQISPKAPKLTEDDRDDKKENEKDTTKGKDSEDKKTTRDLKRTHNDHRDERSRSRSRGRQTGRSRDWRERSRDRRNRSRDRKHSRDRGNQRNRSRERSRDRRGRSRDRRGRSRDRRGRSRDRRGRSQDKRNRSQDRRSRSRDRKSRDRSRERKSSRERSRDRKSRSREKSRERKSGSRDKGGSRRRGSSSSDSSSDSD
ncbi:peptidyl-prolyl cis-trans isomerase G-like isoform X2 [Macrobrachium nipponense]|uniref:peptidyl-prolyl cis-trans isomerase G-like isoform X1 n=1 Tax=Macrobrachium nipponense TaxID=159736 RepID=UPI0030C7AA70